MTNSVTKKELKVGDIIDRDKLFDYFVDGPVGVTEYGQALSLYIGRPITIWSKRIGVNNYRFVF